MSKIYVKSVQVSICVLYCITRYLKYTYVAARGMDITPPHQSGKTCKYLKYGVLPRHTRYHTYVYPHSNSTHNNGESAPCGIWCISDNIASYV